MLSIELTKDTPYLAPSGELWSVFYEYFNINWSCYKGFLLYMCNQVSATRSQIGHPQIKSTGEWSTNEWQWLDLCNSFKDRAPVDEIYDPQMSCSDLT